MSLNIAVFCGSATGQEQSYLQLAEDLAALIARQKFGLVYGGASVGVMGRLADTCLQKNVEVLGVIPQSLVDWEVAHRGLKELVVVDTMHKRKEIMYLRSNAFVVIPGGYGTLDECFEIVTWGQLKLHAKPVYILNYNGFYDHLRLHLEHAHREGFISAAHLQLLHFIDDLEGLEKVLMQLSNS